MLHLGYKKYFFFILLFCTVALAKIYINFDSDTTLNSSKNELAFNNIKSTDYDPYVAVIDGTSENEIISLTNSLAFTIVIDTTTMVKVNASCLGGNDGSISNITVTGTNPTYNYLWSNGENTKDISNLAPGIYTLTVSDPTSIEVSASVTIEILTPVSVITIDSWSNAIPILNCIGDSNGSLGIEFTSPPPSVAVIDWYKDGSVVPFNSGVTDVYNLGVGSYEVKITDTNLPLACPVTQSFEITEPELFSAEQDSFTGPVCFDEPLIGSVTYKITSGTLPYSYSVDGGVPINFTTSLVTISGLTEGSHSIVLTDRNACSPVPFNYTVFIPTEIVVNTSEVDVEGISCYNAGDGRINLNNSVSGGTAPYNYTWTGPAGGTDFGTSVSNLVPGDYILNITDQLGCIAMPVTFTVASKLPIEIIGFAQTNKNLPCAGDLSATIAIQVASDPTSNIQIVWFKNGTNYDNNNVDRIENLGAGTYEVVVTDVNATEECSVSQIFEITEPDAFDAVITSPEDPLCFDAIEGGTLTLEFTGGTLPYSYRIDDGIPVSVMNTVPISITGLADGIHIIELADSNLCNPISEIHMVSYPDSIAYAGPTTNIVDICELSDAFIIDPINVTGGTPFIDGNGDPIYAYEWFGPNDFHAFGAEIPVNIGDYTLIISDSANCETDPISIVLEANYEPISVIEEIGAVSCDEQNDGFISIVIDGGSEPYSIVWEEEIPSANPGSSDPTYVNIAQDLLRLNDLEEGRYRLTVSSNLIACSSDNPASQFQAIYTVNSSQSISVIEPPILDNELCAGNPGSLTVRVSDASSGPISFYYNGSLVNAEAIGNNYYLVYISNPVQSSILDIVNELGCGEAVAFESGVGDPSFQIDSSGYNFNEIINLNEEVTFMNTSSDPYVRSEWDFGDGSGMNTDTSPVYAYSSSGNFTVTLRVYNDLDCYKEYTDQIQVGDDFYVKFPDVFTPNSDGVNDYFQGELIGFDSFEFEIYDLWNNLLFANATSTSGASNLWGWDGNLSDGSVFNGKIFKYVFKGINTSGEEVIVSNQALLLR